LGAALLNVRIPVLLGQLVNVVARCARGHVPTYLREVRRPALRLLTVYCLQVSADPPKGWVGGPGGAPGPPDPAVSQGLLTFGYIALLARVGEQVAGSMRKVLFSALLRQEVAFFDATRTGQLVTRLTADIQEFKSSFKLAVSQVSPAVSWASPVVDRAGHLSEQLGFGIAAFQGLSNLALNGERGPRSGTWGAGGWDSLGQDLLQMPLLHVPFKSQLCPCPAGIVLGTIFVGGSLMAGDELSPGDLMSFLVASQTVQRSGQGPVVVRGLSAGARVFELLRLEPPVPLRGGVSIPAHSLLGHICFHHVSFSYPTRPGYPVLQDFSLTLPPCQTVAIVGPSGGGKSTVAALLERFYEPTAGTITLDGHDIASLDPSWLRGQVIGFISQEPVLFGTTIMENIRFGKPGASDAEVYEAARLANADGFIRSFPEGYDTIVGERGTALSGGQKQRIAIARALLKDPAVLILDEATSALDAQAERAVQEALDRAAAGRTVLLIAHRLSTIRGAHLI
ncbi:ABCB8 protein, partial [Edolisoma coerulescens]|nr:ABCB8 protein [Edolisoma coerulescens]